MATKKNTVPAAAKAEPKPPVAATTVPKAAEVPKDPKRPIMSADSQPKFEPGRVTPPNRGPQTGQDSMSDADYLAQFSDPQERARWRKEVEQRRQQPPPLSFFRCDNPRCGITMRDRADAPDGDFCPKCGLMRRVTDGRLHRMTEAEANAFLFEQAQKDKLEDERRAKARFSLENANRAKSGLAPMSFEQFTAQERRELEELKAAGRQLGEMANLYRPRPK